MIKLIAIDLDGTLLNEKKEISEKNRSVLQKAKQLGVKVVICTGRPLSFIGQHIDTLGLRDSGDYSITFNGGLVQKNDTGEIVEKITFSKELAKEIFELSCQLRLPLDVIASDTVYQIENPNVYQASCYAEINPAMNYEQVTIDELPDSLEYNKMVVACESEYLDAQIKKIPNEYHSLVNLMKSRPVLLEIAPKEVSKAKGIDLLARDLGISADEVMTLGDEANDLSMIEYAGLGVAMGNGSEIIKAAAQVITDTNNNDGVAKAVEEYVIKPLEEKGGL